MTQAAKPNQRGLSWDLCQNDASVSQTAFLLFQAAWGDDCLVHSFITIFGAGAGSSCQRGESRARGSLDKGGEQMV